MLYEFEEESYDELFNLHLKCAEMQIEVATKAQILHNYKTCLKILLKISPEELDPRNIKVRMHIA
jgi:hypothetical protein